MPFEPIFVKTYTVQQLAAELKLSASHIYNALKERVDPKTGKIYRLHGKYKGRRTEKGHWRIDEYRWPEVESMAGFNRNIQWDEHVRDYTPDYGRGMPLIYEIRRVIVAF